MKRELGYLAVVKLVLAAAPDLRHPTSIDNSTQILVGDCTGCSWVNPLRQYADQIRVSTMKLIASPSSRSSYIISPQTLSQNPTYKGNKCGKCRSVHDDSQWKKGSHEVCSFKFGGSGKPLLRILPVDNLVPAF